MAVTAAAASAATFYVSPSGKDTNACTEPGAPCKTIAKAVLDSQLAPGTATIQLAAGVYEESIDLDVPADDGITITGAGSGAGGSELAPAASATEATAHLAVPGGAVTLENVSIVNQSGDAHAGVESESETTLDNVNVDMRNPGAGSGIVQSEIGSMSVNGGSVTMESGSEGVAIGSGFDPLTINNETVTVANGSKATAIESEYGSLSLANTSVSLGSAGRVGIESSLAPATLTNVSVADASEKEPGLAFVLSKSLSINGVRLTMTGSKDTEPGVAVEYDTGATIEGLEVAGGGGPPLEYTLSNFTLRGSRLTANAATTNPAIEGEGGNEGPGLLVQRDVLQASPTAIGTLATIAGNLTVDSSELLGGENGVYFDQAGGKERTLTVSGSTIDAGKLGEADASGAAGVNVVAGMTNSVANARIVGSIVLEKQVATIEAGGSSATIACSYSDAPSQTQAATATEGAIACAAPGAAGETSSEVNSLFSAPVTSYSLNPSSSAIDSVPASAIALPFGLTPSSTDLAGNQRSEGVACATLQDKGALELPGHGTPCPTPPAPAPVAKPLAGVISSLTISPSAFFAAPSGVTVSAAAAKAKKYGAKVSYRDTQVATTTFTVLRETGGRKQGKSCKKPSKHNRHGKRCTILTAVGSFVHVDVAGANSFHFSGRIKGRKLSAGGYRLQAVARDAAGNGVAVDKSFKIE